MLVLFGSLHEWLTQGESAKLGNKAGFYPVFNLGVFDFGELSRAAPLREILLFGEPRNLLFVLHGGRGLFGSEIITHGGSTNDCEKHDRGNKPNRQSRYRATFLKYGIDPQTVRAAALPVIPRSEAAAWPLNHHRYKSIRERAAIAGSERSSARTRGKKHAAAEEAEGDAGHGY